MQPKDEDKKKCGNGKISIRRLKCSKNIVKLIFQNMIGKTLFDGILIKTSKTKNVDEKMHKN